MSDHVETKKKIKSIYSVKTFEELLQSCTLSDEDKAIMRLIYLKGKPLSVIADELGFSESTIKRKHKTILSKLNKLI